MNPLLILWLVYTFCVFVVIFASRAWARNVFFATWFPIILLFPGAMLAFFIGEGYGGWFFGDPLTKLLMIVGPTLLYLVYYLFRGSNPVDRFPTPHEVLDTVILFGEFVLFLFLTSRGGWRIMMSLFTEYSHQALSVHKITSGIFLLVVITDISFMLIGVRPLMTEAQAKQKDGDFFRLYSLKHRIMTTLVVALLLILAIAYFFKL